MDKWKAIGLRVVGVVAAVVAVVVVLALNRPSVDRPTPVQPVRAEESADAKTEAGQVIMKIPADDLEGWLAKNKAKVVSVCPVLRGSGETLRVDHYLVVIER